MAEKIVEEYKKIVLFVNKEVHQERISTKLNVFGAQSHSQNSKPAFQPLSTCILQ